MRTYGLSGSGMDIDQLVQNMMKAQRIPYDRLYQQKTALEWKKADYNTLYTAINDFRSNTVLTYRMQNTLVTRAVDVTNGSVVAATANADAILMSHSLTVTQLASGVTKASSGAITSGASKDTLQNQFNLGDDPFDITITNGTDSATITVDPTQSINELVSSINKTGINVKASYDATLDRFFIHTTNTGSGSGLSFNGSSPEGQAFLTTNLKIDTKAQSGCDAVFNLDGVDLNQAKNTFAISGVTYSLKELGTATINVSFDTDKAVAAVKTFVEAYNDILGKINDKLQEVFYRNYPPLTDAQRKDMKDDEIKAWEERSKSGLLRNDPYLKELVGNMRNSIADPVQGLTGDYRNAASIGITTGAYTENGKLYLDENKLRKALEADPEVLSKIFSTTGSDKSENGIAVRLFADLKQTSDKIALAAGIPNSIDTKSYLAKQIADYDSQMDALDSRLKDVETRYYTQFDAMEAAIQKMNQQSQWLAQQFK